MVLVLINSFSYGYKLEEQQVTETQVELKLLKASTIYPPKLPIEKPFL
tara:strand:- start:646 stop:789 length:144 start_codon:yes stop_codon:yes gene_type:complete